jgi:hypothetical protein
MRITAVIIATAALGWGQAKPPAPAPDTCPKIVLVGGGSYNSQASPHWSSYAGGGPDIGGCTYEFQGVYSTIIGGKLHNSTTAGFAPQIHVFALPGGRNLHLFGLGGAGLSTITTAATTTAGLALNGGVFFWLPLKGSWALTGMAQSLKGSGVQGGLGFGWGGTIK